MKLFSKRITWTLLHGEQQSRPARHTTSLTDVRVLVLGCEGVGKTSIIRRFMENSFSTEHRQTIADLYQYHGDGFRLSVLDTDGRNEFPDMRRVAIQNSDVFVVVFSVADLNTFEEVRNIREEILSIKRPDVPIIVVGNKKDLQTRDVSLEYADLVSSVEFGTTYHEVSAKEDWSILTIFEDAVDRFPNLRGREVHPATKNSSYGCKFHLFRRQHGL